MKNIHIIPTDKPSRLHLAYEKTFILSTEPTSANDLYKSVPQHIYITSDEEIKKGDWHFKNDKMVTKSHIIDDTCKKIILTTDPDLIKDGVQAIDNEFLQWFVKNPDCEKVEVILDEVSYVVEDNIYKITIPKEEPKQEYICYKCQNKTNNKFEICDKCNVGWKEPNKETLEDELWGNVFAKIKQYGLNNEVLIILKQNFKISKL